LEKTRRTWGYNQPRYDPKATAFFAERCKFFLQKGTHFFLCSPHFTEIHCNLSRVEEEEEGILFIYHDRLLAGAEGGLILVSNAHASAEVELKYEGSSFFV
jgi:hypothetical protein